MLHSSAKLDLHVHLWSKKFANKISAQELAALQCSRKWSSRSLFFSRSLVASEKKKKKSTKPHAKSQSVSRLEISIKAFSLFFFSSLLFPQRVQKHVSTLFLSFASSLSQAHEKKKKARSHAQKKKKKASKAALLGNFAKNAMLQFLPSSSRRSKKEMDYTVGLKRTCRFREKGLIRIEYFPLHSPY
jgi:hypothetical protein